MSSNQMVPVGDMFSVMGKKIYYYSDQKLFRKILKLLYKMGMCSNNKQLLFFSSR